ncbi:MAG: UTP--glucose-1-phosphate uridylyltransferase [Gammaproteobacteria bacterium]|jgi:UTP--glucose-1-phosphate uridylyltransferase
MGSRVRKAVFPVAGLGTRFLPATKATPKEMLPVVDKPLIHYAAEEAVAAGCTELIFVTGRTKRAIEDHFDKSIELEVELEARGKDEMLAVVRQMLPTGVSCVYIRQPEPLGLGHAVLCALPAVGDEPFAVILPDDLIYTEGRGCLEQMIDVFETYNASVIAVEEVPQEDTDKYGIVAVQPGEGPALDVTQIVEKPSPDAAPSRLAVVGRYILDGKIMQNLAHTGRGAGGEIQLTDAIAELVESDQDRVMAYRFDGRRFDCGSKLGYLEATVELALKHKELGAPFRAYLDRLNSKR